MIGIQMKREELINPHSAGTDFISQNRPSVAVRFWRIKAVPELKELKYF